MDALDDKALEAGMVCLEKLRLSVNLQGGSGKETRVVLKPGTSWSAFGQKVCEKLSLVCIFRIFKQNGGVLVTGSGKVLSH